MVNHEIKEYITTKILPEYELNDKGHNLVHVNKVLERAFEISKKYEVDENMLYVVVCFHDIACHINREKHEILSAERLYADVNLKQFFSEEQIEIMRDAVADHRASLEYIPRNIYGKILSSADRKVDIEEFMRASMGFQKSKEPNSTDDELIEHSYLIAIKKFGKNGYAVKKFYVEDEKYEKFLKELQDLIDNKPEFIERAKKVLIELKKEF